MFRLPCPVLRTSPSPCISTWASGSATISYRYSAARWAGSTRWCAEWWRHDEAVSRLKALWHAWEVLRLQPGTGIGTWYREHLDHQLPILMGARGPFYQCSETVHREPHEAAAQVLPAGRQDPTVAGEYGAMPGRESAALGQHTGAPDDHA